MLAVLQHYLGIPIPIQYQNKPLELLLLTKEALTLQLDLVTSDVLTGNALSIKFTGEVSLGIAACQRRLLISLRIAESDRM